MKISCNWLRDYIKTSLSVEEIADKLTLTGLEVEETTETGQSFDGIVIGEVLEAISHPNADRLRVCKVNTGNETVQIVCGAPNVAAGQKVAVATVGAVLPVLLDDGSFLKIRKSKIRGEVSQGMICSEDELGIGSDHSGIMVLETSLKPGTPFSEVQPSSQDWVIEIGLTPNRPDAACHAGTARDLHAVTGEELTIPSPDAEASQITADGHPSVSIYIENKELCHRYVGVVMKGVTVKESPDWVKQRLTAIGLRPRNAIVDATNYVLHELGQPLHAFDLSSLEGNAIIVKSFETETTFTTLDETKRSVPAGSLFICDANRPVALAGVMGGMNSEISDKTTDILIESAWFDPVSIRKTSKKLALQSDSSYRFERGVDPTITRRAALRCAALIQEWAGGEITYPVIDVHPVSYEAPIVTLRPERLHKIVGTDIPVSEMTAILDRLGFEPTVENGLISCNIPGYRPDVSEEIDLIEEVARIYDYNKIPTTGRITFARPPVLPFMETFISNVRNTCVSLGLQEIYTNSLLPEKMAPLFGDEDTLIPTLNPISKDQAVMRPSLSYGFLKAASWNFNRKTSGVQLFEIGHIFSKGTGTWIDGIDESASLLIGLGGFRKTEYWNQSAETYTFHHIRGFMDAFLKRIRLFEKTSYEFSEDETILTCKNKRIGTIRKPGKELLQKFEIDSELIIAEFNLDILGDLVQRNPAVRYQPIPKYPSFEFDLALVIDKHIQAGKLLDYIRSKGGKKLEEVGIFDVFEGKPLENHQKSIAFRLQFKDVEKTLTIQDVQPVINKLLKGLGSEFNAELRS